MNIIEAKRLVGKFLDGKTSLEEEQKLGGFFRDSEKLPDELMVYKQMFAYFDEGMTDGKFLISVDKDEKGRQNNLKKNTVWLKSFRTVVAVAAAVIFLIMYNLAFTEDTASVKTNSGELAYKSLVADSTDAKSDTINQKGSNSRPYVDSQRKKWHYRPAPEKPLLADTYEEHNLDSINGVALQMAGDELRKIEEQQQYVINLIKAVDIINSAEIASVADGVDVY